MEINLLTKEIIGAMIEVHKFLGPGMLESSYEECGTYEPSQRGLFVERHRPIPVIYKEIKLDYVYRIDILVNDLVVLELKSVEALAPVHEAQILAYMLFSQKKVGLLIIFNVTVLKNGIRRFIL